MSLLKQRNLKILIPIAVALLVLFVGALFLSGRTEYITWCPCIGEWSGGICQTDDWVYDLSSPQAPYPICHLRGVHSSKWICVGSWERHPVYSGVGTFNNDTCQGLQIDLGQRYGIPYSASSNDKGGPISCNYPCDDKQLLEACKTQDVVKFDRVIVSCVELGKWCRR